MKTQDGHLYWNNRGHITCFVHAPYPVSDTWLSERWERVPDDVAQTNRLSCEICGFVSSPPLAQSVAADSGRGSRRWRIRTNCEYTIEIEAADAEEAIEKAGHVDFDQHWIRAWAPMEVDEEA